MGVIWHIFMQHFYIDATETITNQAAMHTKKAVMDQSLSPFKIKKWGLVCTVCR